MSEEYSELDKRRGIGDDYSLAIQVIDFVKQNFELSGWDLKNDRLYPKYEKSESIACRFFGLDWEEIQKQTDLLYMAVAKRASEEEKDE